MNCFKKLVLGSALIAFSTVSAWASPSKMVTVNKSQANVYASIGGMQSTDPVKPGEKRERSWFMVKGICAAAGQTKTCSAEVVAQDGNSKVSIGKMNLDLDSGDITPKKQTSENGKYTLTVTGVAQVLITQK